MEVGKVYNSIKEAWFDSLVVSGTTITAERVTKTGTNNFWVRVAWTTKTNNVGNLGECGLLSFYQSMLKIEKRVKI